MLQKLLQEAEKRRQEAKEAAEQRQTNQSDATPSDAEQTLPPGTETSKPEETESSPPSGDINVKELESKKLTDNQNVDDIKSSSPKETKLKHSQIGDHKKSPRGIENKNTDSRSGDGNTRKVRHAPLTGKSHDKTHSKKEPHLASLAEES